MKITVDEKFEGIPEPVGDAATAPLVQALVALEDLFVTEEPESVVVTDDSEAALAAALVATKLLIPLEATGDAIADSPNGRLLAQLAAPAA
jgi:hypothetical protein